jgi:hypothetical protein
MSQKTHTADKLGNVQRTSSNGIDVADFEHNELVSATTSIRMTTFCNTARGGKDETVTSSFVLVGNYLYPACVADMVLRTRIGTHEASP